LPDTLKGFHLVAFVMIMASRFFHLITQSS
jgi:hypothetical protein